MPDSSASRGLVTLVNPNFVQPGVTPYALDILASHLETEGFAVEVVDLTFAGSDWRLAEYFGVRCGVKGPGERILCALAAALAAGRPPEQVRGLLVNDGRHVTPAAGELHPIAGKTFGDQVTAHYQRRSGIPLRVDNGQVPQRYEL